MKNFAPFPPLQRNLQSLTVKSWFFNTIKWYLIVIYSGGNQLRFNIYMTVLLNHRQKTILKGHSSVICEDVSNKVDVYMV